MRIKSWHLALFGNPVEHSLSPVLQKAFAKQFDLNICYQKILTPITGFKKAVEKFFATGGDGANVTLPFKEDAFQLVDTRSDIARVCGAVNTLIQTKTGLLGDNTDGFGLVSDLNHQGISLKEKRILLLGAGGAARGVLAALVQEHPKKITVSNRTFSKAQHLARTFSLCALPLMKTGEDRYDLIINATSSSITGALLPLPESVFSECKAAYDMMYGAQESPFLHYAKEKGVTHISDGLGMVVYQGAASFALWTGKQPDVQPVLNALKTRLSILGMP